MFSIKIFQKREDRSFEFSSTINNIISHIFNKLNISNSKVISDNSCIEIVSGRESPPKEDEIIVELLIRKHVIIKLDDFQDKRKLDEHIYLIKHFCEQAKEIEEIKYLPINMR